MGSEEEVPGMPRRKENGKERKERRGLRLDLRGMVEIEINSQLLLDWGPRTGRNSLTVKWMPRH
jgi:hypothetical protein